MNDRTFDKIAALALCATIILFFCAEIFLNLTPPISRDALIQHLAIPKLWLKHGRIYEMPWANYAYYPMNINLLYALCLYLNNDIAPKFIHLAFGMGTGLLLYLFIKQRYDRNWGLLGGVIFMTTPIVVWLSTSAYIDLGMTFFTTGSVLSFIKWRDSEYHQFKWFLISSFCMGIAVGSKYNALIVLFIVNILLVMSFARDTRQQIKALQYGVLFFILTAFVGLPWYFKNYFQTGNPFYPLFDSFFKSLHHHPVQDAVYRQAIEISGQISFFKMREVMYGESFWETLLIPIRMFFQGQDNSYQYFQGSLNPILILFLPFIMLNKRYGKDKIFFVCFTVIFIIIAFFLTAKQVRYILPVIPILVIIAVMGIKELLDKLDKISIFTNEREKSVGKVFILASVAILLSFNFIYLKNRMQIVKPFPYVLGEESRQEYLKRHLLHYDAVEYINNNLPGDAKIFTMFLGRRGYYLDRDYKNESSFGMATIRHMVNSSDDEDKFLEYIRSMNVTHILMRGDLVKKYLQDNFSTKEVNRLLKLIREYWEKDYENDGYIVWDIQNRR